MNGAILMVKEGRESSIYLPNGEQLTTAEAWAIIKSFVEKYGIEAMGTKSIEFLSADNSVWYIPVVSTYFDEGYAIARGDGSVLEKYGRCTVEIAVTETRVTVKYSAIASPSNLTPLMDGTASAGSSDVYARGDHVHPTDTTRQAKLTGTKGQIVGFDESGAAAAQDDKAVMLGEAQVALPSREYWMSVTYGNGKFVAITDSSGKVAYSTDGINWTATTLPSSASFRSVTYGNGKFVAVAYNSNTAVYSTDGITWTAATLPSNANWQLVTYGNGKFVAFIGYSTKAAYSTDGITWTATTLPSSVNWMSATYGNSKFVTVASGSTKAAYSTDGITWTAATLPSSASWYSVTYGNGKFVAVAYNSNTAAYSTDGITWTAATLPSSASFRSVTYGNGKFVAVAYNSNTAVYSTDGITWTAATLPSSANWRSVTYGNGKFVAVAYNSKAAAYSTDGITWQDSEPYLSDSSDEDITDKVAELIQSKLDLSGKLDKSGGTMTGDINIYPDKGIAFAGAGVIYSDGNSLFIKSLISGVRIELSPDGDVLINNHSIAIQPKATLVTLTASGWTDNTQTVNVSGVLADETAQFIQVKPASASAAAYYESVVYNSGQAADSLTFACLVEPTEDLDVYVTMQDVDYS